MTSSGSNPTNSATDEYINAPVIDSQNQPTTNGDSMSAILAAKGRYQMLFALLAGCGPMRAGEALGLEIEKHSSSDFRTLYIQQKAKAGEIQTYLKTKNGAREIDLCVDLAEMLRAYVGDRTSGLLFHTSSGAQMLQTNVLCDSLHPTLETLKHGKGGFNIFRRYRLTLLGKSDCPMCSSISGPGTRPNIFRNGMKNYTTSGNTGLNGPSGSASDSRFAARLANPAYFAWYRMPRKWLIYLVDETGVEPATSSLRTQGTDLDRELLNYTVDPTKPIA
jgi:hypothetical protein